MKQVILCLSIFLGLLPAIGFAQGISLDRETIVEHGIREVSIYIKPVIDLQHFNSLSIGEHRYNQHGFKTWEKRIYPYQDVVTTVSQVFYEYAHDTLLVKEVSTHSQLILTEADKQYTRLFGIDYDTTTVEFHYDEKGMLQSKVSYSNSSKDSLSYQYWYNEKQQLTRLKKANSSYQGKAHDHNFEEQYFYADNGLLDSVQRHFTHYEGHATTLYRYDRQSRLIEKKEINGISFGVKMNDDGTSETKVVQDYNQGSVEKNEYDQNGLLIKTGKGLYSPNEIDYTTHYVYNNQGQLIERYTESHSESVIVITGRMKYRYNAKGLRIAEEVVKNQETQFENAIQYR